MLSEIKDTYNILNNNQKRKSFFLIIFILINVCIEILALFIIYDFIKITTSSIFEVNFYKKNEYLNYFFSLIDSNYDINNLLNLILFIYVLKFLLNTLFNFFQYYFLNNTKVYLNYSLFSGYLKKNYSFHLNNSPVSLIRNTEAEVAQFILGCFMQMIFIITEGFLIIAIISSLFLVNAKIVIYSVISFFFYGFIYLSIIKPSLEKYGKERIFFSTNFLKVLSEGFYGVKSIKLNNALSFFENSLKDNAKRLAKTSIYFSTISQLPKSSLELLIIFVITIFYKFNYIQTSKVEPSIIASLGFFLIASFKLIPSLSKVILGFQSLKYSKKSIQIIKKEIKSVIFSKKENLNNLRRNEKKITFSKRIILKDVFFKYPNTSNLIFKKINLIIKKGDKIGIIGDSGSGKSTLVDILTGLLNVQKGFLKVDGKIITKNYKTSWISKIGYVPQKIYLTDDNLINNIAFGDTIINSGKLKETILQVGLDKLMHLEKNLLNRKLGSHGVKLSGGQVQRIGIARCLYKNPELLIFDESTNSLDIKSEKKIIELIKKISKHKTLIMISHNPKNLIFCNKIYKIENCKLKKL